MILSRQHQGRIDPYLVGENSVLERIASGAPLVEILNHLINLVEAQTESVICSILVLDEDSNRLRHVAAPSLPESFVSGMDAMSIGPNADCCGTAASVNQPVIVKDILKDPRWDGLRSIAITHGIRAFWCNPIPSLSSGVAGTFAMYYHTPREPHPEELRLAEAATHVASIAIENYRSEESLRRAEERNKAILNAIPDSMFLLDSQYNYIDCHTRDSCRRLVTPPELIGRNMRDSLPPDMVEKFSAGLQRARESGEPQLVEYDFELGGQLKYSEGRVIPTSDGKFLVLVRDITERRLAEQALRTSEERFRLVTMATRDGVYDWDLNAHTVWRSHAFHTLFSPDEPSENTHEWWEQQIHPDDYPRIKRSFEDASAKQKQVWSAEYLFRKADGSYATVFDRCYIRYDDSGRPERVIGIMSDVTERRLTEQNLQKSETELRKRNAEIHELAGRLMTAQEEERRRISRDLHDDLNQKVAALSLMITALKKQLPKNNESLREQFDDLLESSFEISADIRRLSHKLHPAILEHVGLAAALTGYVAEFNRLEKVDVRLTVPEFIEVPRDVAVCLYRVAQEALRNVVKHAGVLQAELSLSADDGAIRFCVSDSGVGFDMGAASNYAGLGLVSMEERVRLIDGTLNIFTSPGRGTRLLVTVPKK